MSSMCLYCDCTACGAVTNEAAREAWANTVAVSFIHWSMAQARI